MLLKNKNDIKPFGAIPSTEQTVHMNLEKKAFFHYGMNTFTNAEWGDGKENTDAFMPKKADTEQWIRVAKEAGFKLAIITVKHHDGFCIWPSKYTEHTVAGSRYMDGNADIVKDFSDSVHKAGLMLGLYISPWDRNSRFWGMDEYSEHYARQLTELVTGYGEIREIWWDGAGSSETEYNWQKWTDIIHENQPRCIMFGSLGATDYVSIRWVGNERGFAGSTHYASIDAQSLRVENTDELNTGKLGGERYIPAEVDVSVRPGWFYHAEQSDKVKSPRALDDIWFDSVGRNAIMLLNFPPNRESIVEDTDAARAIESHKRIEKMRSKNLLDGAEIISDGEDISELIGESSLSYLSDKNELTLKIKLPSRVPANVFAIGEVFERGERIYELSLLDGESGELIASATSVGRLRAIRFPERTCSSFTVHIKAAAPITLSSMLALWYYEAPTVDENEESSNKNLLLGGGASVSLSADRCEAILNFGGIFRFDQVRFMTEKPAHYTVYSFDGSRFHPIADTYAESGNVSEKLRDAQHCYQIKIVTDSPFASEPEFSVF